MSPSHRAPTPPDGDNSAAPAVCVLDVNETLSDMTPLAERLAAVGLDGQLEAWFASVLRDGFALSLVGRGPAMKEIAAALLRQRLTAAGRSGADVDDGVQHVLEGFAALPLHPDVVPALQRLHEAGVRLVPLTNGATALSDQLFERAGVLPLFERRLSADDVGPWKPHPAPYAHALAECGVGAAEAMLVAVHPWDVQGAHSAGLRTAWIRRGAGEWPTCFDQPDLTATGLDDLTTQLLG